MPSKIPPRSTNHKNHLAPFNSYTRNYVFAIPCPKCHAGANRWCRENGKSVQPHRERRRAALDQTMAAFGFTRRETA